MKASQLLLTGLLAATSSSLPRVAAQASQPSSITVTVTNGTLQGRPCPNTPGVAAFLAIPYASPPTGALRFAAPSPFNARYGSNGSLDASRPPPACPQFGTTFLDRGPSSEDCLFLNVWAPTTARDDTKLPVKVWLHGGANEAGSGMGNGLYDGCVSAGDAVVVTVNYRLGPLGWLSLGSMGLEGNYGLRDQLLALRWVRENAGAFGGDPDKILLFGESAGAWDTFAIASLPQAPGLIAAAAMQSGGGIDFATLAQAERYNTLFVTKLGCDGKDLACLRSKSPADLNKTYAAMPRSPSVQVTTLMAHLGKGVAWGPIIDGKLIPEQPSSTGVRVPSIFGSNTDEGGLFVLGQFKADAFKLSSAQYDEFLTGAFGPLAGRVNGTFPFSKFAGASAQGYAAMSTIDTDVAFRCPARRALQKAAANGVPAYAYVFNRTLSCSWFSDVPNVPDLLKALGATHTAEIPFVFGKMNGLPPPDGNCSLGDADRKISAVMRASWVSMAERGRPDDTWPAFTVNGSQGVVLGDDVESATLNYKTCDFWDQINAEVSKLAANSSSLTDGGTPTSSGEGPAQTNLGAVLMANIASVGAMAITCLVSMLI